MSEIAEIAVARFYERYARFVDAKDYDALAAMCSPDVRLVRPGDERQGVGELVAAYREALDSTLGSRHLLTNIAVDVRDGIRARAYFLVVYWSESWTRQIVGRYEDDLAWVDGQLVFVVKRIYGERVNDLPAVEQAV